MCRSGLAVRGDSRFNQPGCHNGSGSVESELAMDKDCSGGMVLADEFKGLVQSPGINRDEVKQWEIEIGSALPEGMGSISLGSQVQDS